MNFARLIPLALLVLFATGCSVNPVTGKRQLNFYSEQDEIDLGTEADQQIVAQYGILDSPEVQAYVEDIGARMVSDHFEMAGWDSIFLGADTPSDALVRVISDFGADLVAVSSGLGINVRATAALVKAIHASGDVPVLVGGLPFLAVPGLWKDVGADASADNPGAAVRELRS